MNDQLIEILAQSVVQGRFYATGKRSLLDLGLEVKGVGAIRTPVAPGRAKQIIKQCRQAPYGLGHKTLVDTCVRNVWELGPRKFKIHSPQWKHQLADLVEEVGKQLGLADQKIKAQLYKMLIYEKGSFFVPHQDTEKTDAMFATMVVVLPSRHSGGALVISHNGEDKKLFFGGKNSDATIQYAGFYADCRHEVKPITDGYRVCLVYNLSLPKKVSIPLTPQNRTAQKKVAELLQEWSKKSEQPEKKSILFDHQYTSAELSLKNLKSKDFVTGEILSQAAQEAQCEVHLALLAFHQSGTPSGGYDDYDRYYRSRRGYYSRYYEDEEDEDDKYIDSGAVMEDIFEEDLSVTQWFTLGGQKKEMGFIPISTDDVIASIDFEDKDPDESQY